VPSATSACPSRTCSDTWPGTSARPASRRVWRRARRVCDHAKLFAPRDRLQPAARRALFDRGTQRSDDIPGNANIDATAAAGARAIFLPYHARIASNSIGVREGRQTILISVHSFTPVYHAVARPWQIGMLYGRDARVAHRLLAIIRAEGRWNVGDNEPYAVTATTDYAIPVHCETRGIAHVGLEIRQDLIAQADGQAEWATRIAGWLKAIAAEFSA
jgi:predicted N-formylglutamate amidohydrolase